MERGDFFSRIREDMSRSAGNEDVPVERIKEVAKKALEAGAAGEDVPDDTIERLRAENPDVLGNGDRPSESQEKSGKDDGLDAPEDIDVEPPSVSGRQ